jgi:hypothetical protein
MFVFACFNPDAALVAPHQRQRIILPDISIVEGVRGQYADTSFQHVCETSSSSLRRVRFSYKNASTLTVCSLVVALVTSVLMQTRSNGVPDVPLSYFDPSHHFVTAWVQESL